MILICVFLKELHLQNLCNLSGFRNSRNSNSRNHESMKIGYKTTHDLCLVVGDVNSVACAIFCAKGCSVGQEAGLRSFDRAMPEKLTILPTASLLSSTEFSAVKNLRKEGHSRSNIYLVGNTMIDTLMRMKSSAMSMGAHRN